LELIKELYYDAWPNKSQEMQNDSFLFSEHWRSLIALQGTRSWRWQLTCI